MDEVTLTLSSPMTEEQWDMIADYDFNYTNEITFHTKHGKTVRFVKESARPEVMCYPQVDGITPCVVAQPERKTGEWIGYNADKSEWQRTDGSPIFMSCSECFGTVINNGSAHWNFCPNCGADMRGDKDETD